MGGDGVDDDDDNEGDDIGGDGVEDVLLITGSGEKIVVALLEDDGVGVTGTGSVYVAYIDELLVPFTASKLEVVLVMPLLSNVVVFDSKLVDMLEMVVTILVLGLLVVPTVVVVFDSQVVEGVTGCGATDVSTFE